MWLWSTFISVKAEKGFNSYLLTWHRTLFTTATRSNISFSARQNTQQDQQHQQSEILKYQTSLLYLTQIENDDTCEGLFMNDVIICDGYQDPPPHPLHLVIMSVQMLFLCLGLI